MNANSTTATLTIPIEDDEIDEADGNITVTINAPTNAGDYQVGTANVGQVSECQMMMLKHQLFQSLRQQNQLMKVVEVLN